MLNNADQVNHYSATSGYEKDHILLKKKDKDGPEWSLAVESKTEEHEASDIFEPAEQIRSIISIQKIVDGYGRDYFSYCLGADGIVRRYDHGDAYAKVQQEKAMGLGRVAVPDPESPEFEEDVMDRISEIVNVDVPNSRLERQMGLNQQPISLEEIQGLEDFVSQPGFEVPNTLVRSK